MGRSAFGSMSSTYTPTDTTESPMGRTEITSPNSTDESNSMRVHAPSSTNCWPLDQGHASDAEFAVLSTILPRPRAPHTAKSRYIRSMIVFRVALGRIAAAHLASSGK